MNFDQAFVMRNATGERLRLVGKRPKHPHEPLYQLAGGGSSGILEPNRCWEAARERRVISMKSAGGWELCCLRGYRSDSGAGRFANRMWSSCHENTKAA